MELLAILDKVQQLGISLTVMGDRIQYRPASRMPSDMVDILRSHKAELLHTLKRRQISGSDPFCWVLEEWRRISIPQWRSILQYSIDKGEKKREDYARWMLREILLDPEYQEPGA